MPHRAASVVLCKKHVKTKIRKTNFWLAVIGSSKVIGGSKTSNQLNRSHREEVSWGISPHVSRTELDRFQCDFSQQG